MNFVGFYDCWNDFQKQFSTQVFVITDKPKDAELILIAFRGTEPFDADDWTTDCDYSWYEVPGAGKIHVGFLEALGLGNREAIETLMTRVPPWMAEKSAYYKVAAAVKRLVAQHGNAKFVVTGHSMGGALAILFPVVLFLQREGEMVRRWLGTYTFGQPRIGDVALGRFMELHSRGRFYRVVYGNDVVPRLPYDDENFMFKHFGTCLYYTTSFKRHVVEEAPDKNFFGLRYVLAMHVNAVRELLRSLTMGHVYGPEYTEGWFCVFLRLVGLFLPGISAHCMTNYINCVRLGTQNRLLS